LSRFYVFNVFSYFENVVIIHKLGLDISQISILISFSAGCNVPLPSGLSITHSKWMCSSAF